MTDAEYNKADKLLNILENIDAHEPETLEIVIQSLRLLLMDYIERGFITE